LTQIKGVRVAKAKKKKKKAPSVENAFTANWRAHSDEAPRRSLAEAPLYTDVWLTGDREQVGPYLFLNTRAFVGPRDTLKPALMLRYAYHLPEEEPSKLMQIGAEHYHGGDLLDEAAALVALFMEVRAQAGSTEREFAEGGDPHGTPIRYGLKNAPVLPVSARAPQIPRLLGSRPLGPLRETETILTAPPVGTNALIKAARLYQQAVWVADGDPASAWLYLVSAVETAANTWDASEVPSETALAEGLPTLHELLRTRAPDVLGEAAEILAHQLRATRKFVDFIVRFAPEAPPERPTPFLCFPFEAEKLRQAAAVIYRHRSNALHGGVGFPLPMCEPPRRFAFEGREDAAVQEVQAGLATAALGASWQASETPMLLHTFAYIARGAILKWWREGRPPLERTDHQRTP
jgi:hypothetical protein